MSTSYEDKIKEQAEPYLEPGERVLAAFIAQPRGANMATAGGLAPSAIGGRKVKEARRAAEASGLQLARPMALAVTDRRLVVLKISPPIMTGLRPIRSDNAPQRTMRGVPSAKPTAKIA